MEAENFKRIEANEEKQDYWFIQAERERESQ